MANFSQSLAQYSQAVANRKTRREIKKQQEEAEAARRAASNARSNNGLISTLGGAAAAIGVGAYGGWNPATMAMAYQAGSALAGGLNRTVKPYNSQELAGMPYTQPSGWETLNQVAPSVMSAYGAYQTAQQQQQQNDYNSQLNNLLKMHQIMDMNPAATMGMINQLNTDHSKKYELDGKQPYMFDMGATSGVSSDQFNYKQTMSNMSAAEKNAITNGNLEWFEQNKDHEYFTRAGKDYETSLKYATQNRNSIDAKADRDAAAANRADQKHNMAVTEYTQKQADRMIEPFAESIKVANNEKDLLRMSKNLDEEFSNNKNWTQNQKALLGNQLSAKYYEVVQKPRQEEYKTELKELVKQVNSQTQPVSKEEFMAVAVDKAKLHPDVAEGMWAAAHNKSAQERDDKFLAKASSVDLWNRDLLGREIKREPEVVREQVAYMWEVMGASNGALHQAYEALGVLKKGEAGGGGHGPDVSDKVTMMNMGNGEVQAIDISPNAFTSTGELKENVNQRVQRQNVIAPPFAPKYTQQSQPTQQPQQNQQLSSNPWPWDQPNSPPTFQQAASGNQNAAWLEMQAGKQDGPPAAEPMIKSPAVNSQQTPVEVPGMTPPSPGDDTTDEFTGTPYSQGTATDQQYAAALKDILEKSKAKTTEEKRPLNPMERNRQNNPVQLYHGNSLTPFRSDSMNELWHKLAEEHGGP